jgi:hypothetical protein
MDWRMPYKNDGMRRYSEGSGGVNQMTIARFEKLIRESPFEFVSFEPVPIRKLKWAHNRLTREFTTAVVRAELRLRPNTGTSCDHSRTFLCVSG